MVWSDWPVVDHPRSRGVYAGVDGAGALVVGSSPLARGLRPRRRVAYRHYRIIPARAGFTVGLRGYRDGDGGSSPLARGLPTSGPTRLTIRGSSPLARGLPALLRRHIPHPRIIPARAGFTPLPRPRPNCQQDHPRSRGVYAIHRPAASGPSGSSPLARGLPPSKASSPARRSSRAASCSIWPGAACPTTPPSRRRQDGFSASPRSRR